MCGRTACALSPEDISKQCSYKDKGGKSQNPEWKLNLERYKPGLNVAPQSYCPVLINGRHLFDHYPREECKQVLTTMRWGLVNTWMNVTNIKKMSFNMNNARSETMQEKRSYSVPLFKGQRCVVLCEGFYEWNKIEKGKTFFKQPYYIYYPGPSDTKENTQIKVVKDGESCKKDVENFVKLEENVTENQNKEVKDEENIVKPLLAMAGIFEKAYVDDEDLYSFSVITMESHKSFSWLHHRMPAVLEGKAEIETWLDNENVPLVDAVKLIKPRGCLKWHPVSKYVSNSRNQGPECRAAITAEEVNQLLVPKMSSSAKSMMSWLNTSSQSNDSLFEKNVSPNKKVPTKRRTSRIENFFTKKPKSQ